MRVESPSNESGEFVVTIDAGDDEVVAVVDIVRVLSMQFRIGVRQMAYSFGSDLFSPVKMWKEKLSF